VEFNPPPQSNGAEITSDINVTHTSVYSTGTFYWGTLGQGLVKYWLLSEGGQLEIEETRGKNKNLFPFLT